MFVAGYWPSYNVPFYPAIYNLSGYAAELSLTQNSALCYETTARAILFRRDQSKVVDVPSLQEFSRYNGMYLGQFKSELGHSQSWNSSVNTD